MKYNCRSAWRKKSCSAGRTSDSIEWTQRVPASRPNTDALSIQYSYSICLKWHHVARAWVIISLNWISSPDRDPFHFGRHPSMVAQRENHIAVFEVTYSIDPACRQCRPSAMRLRHPSSSRIGVRRALIETGSSRSFPSSPRTFLA